MGRALVSRRELGYTKGNKKIHSARTKKTSRKKRKKKMINNHHKRKLDGNAIEKHEKNPQQGEKKRGGTPRVDGKPNCRVNKESC